MTEQRTVIADFVIHRYLDQTKPNWTAADDALLRGKYASFRKADPSVSAFEQWATNLGHPDFEERHDHVVAQFRQWLIPPS
jgi:hypothetical protein